MKTLISHRGNINGINLELENSPDYIETAMQKYDVEIDVWYVNNNYYLGHDKPTYLVDEDFLDRGRLWCHAKNIDALNQMLKTQIHCFWHQNDDRTLTSERFIWTFPGKELTANSIAVLPELTTGWDISKAWGICSDFIERQ